MNQAARGAYFKSQVIANLWINSALNGVIAFFFYRSREIIRFDEAAVDNQITVAIIAFFVSWIGIAAARKKFSAGGATLLAAGDRRISIPLPANAVLCSLSIMAALMLLYGGLGLIGPLSLVQASGFANWGYILFKTIYTGGCAACASALAVWSVFGEYGE